MKLLLIQVLDIYMFVIIIRVVLSWIKVSHSNPVIGMIYTLTEPVLEPIRRILPNMGGIDLSPLVVFFAYNLLLKPFIISL